MQSRIIDHGVFEQIEKRSFRNMESELREAAQHLQKVFGIPFNYESMNESYVLFRSDRGNEFLKARYSFTDRDTIKLESLERLVVSEASKKAAKKEVIGKVVDGLADGDKDKANEAWQELMARFPISEMVKSKAGKGDVGGGDPAKAQNADEENNASQGRARANKKGAIRGDEEMPASGQAPKGELATLKAIDPALEENAALLPNYTALVSQLVEAAEDAAEEVLDDEVDKVKVKKSKKAKKDEEPDGDEDDDDADEKKSKKDDDGDEDEIDSIEIDTTKKAKEADAEAEECGKRRGKIAEARKAFAKSCEGEKFCDKIKKIKKANNCNDEKELAEALSDLVVKTPSLIYVSRDELKGVIANVLESAGEENWDAALCEDIAFGLRKLAYNTHSDRAYDVIKGAALDSVVDLNEEVDDDDYEAFESVSSRYFESIYARFGKQVKALNNLAETLTAAANVLESEVVAAGLDKKVCARTVLEYRQMASKLRAQVAKGINESVVRAVVGSLLSRHADDYSLNNGATLVDPGHFRGSADLEQDYEKIAGKNKSQLNKGDEGMTLSNPMSPKDKEGLDLDKGGDAPKDFKTWEKGIHDNPLAPKAKGAKELDLD